MLLYSSFVINACIVWSGTITFSRFSSNHFDPVEAQFHAHAVCSLIRAFWSTDRCMGNCIGFSTGLHWSRYESFRFKSSAAIQCAFIRVCVLTFQEDPCSGRQSSHEDTVEHLRRKLDLQQKHIRKLETQLEAIVVEHPILNCICMLSLWLSDCASMLLVQPGKL